MKVLLVCAQGMSTSILMKKLRGYAEEQGIDFEINAVGIGSFKEVCEEYDCVLLGPQISYRKDEVVRGTTRPVGVIAPADYGIGRCENIFKLIDSLLQQ